METTPKLLTDALLKLYYREISIEQFEKWVYEEKGELEKVLLEEFYFELISFDYREPFSWYSLWTILEQYIKKSDWETLRIKAILQDIIDAKSDYLLGKHLLSSYDEYCKGYRFLMVLAIDCYLINDKELSETIPKTNTNKFLELRRDATEAAKKVLSLLDRGLIELTADIEHEPFYHNVFIDHRDPVDIDYQPKLTTNTNESNSNTSTSGQTKNKNNFGLFLNWFKKLFQ